MIRTYIKRILGIMLCLCLLMGFSFNALAVGDAADPLVSVGDVVSEPTLTEGYYLIHNASQLIWFANQVNAGNTSYNAKLMEDIDLNPGYTFTFDPDTGLAEVKKDESTVGYFGTCIKGNAGGNTIFDTTFSTKGLFYSSKESTDTITAPDELVEWTPIGSPQKRYRGTFDGNGKTVSGVYYNLASNEYIGLFGYIVNTGHIKELTVANSYINGFSRISGVCGSCENGKISNCSNSGIVIGDNEVGGVCGRNDSNGIITSCSNTGVVRCGTNVGGVCGMNDHVGIITNCSNSGSVIGEMNVGGVCGNSSSSGTFSSCLNTGKISGELYVGGVCGYKCSGTIKYCYSTGSVSGESYAGGVCGWNDNATITSCYSIGEVAATGDAGGVCGLSNGMIENCYYLDDEETDYIYGGTTFKTSAEFADGSVTYLLNGNRSEETEESPIGWYQNIDNGHAQDTIPRLSGGTVYYVEMLDKYSNDPEGVSANVISVTITWGAMDFTYTDASEGTWNPDTLSYDNSTDAEWTCNTDANKITVTSESEVELTAEFSYVNVENIAVSGSFTDGTSPITAALAIANGIETPQTVSAYLILDGEPEETANDTVVGIVTVTIGEK